MQQKYREVHLSARGGVRLAQAAIGQGIWE
jgi:hypothetical protein